MYVYPDHFRLACLALLSLLSCSCSGESAEPEGIEPEGVEPEGLACSGEGEGEGEGWCSGGEGEGEGACRSTDDCRTSGRMCENGRCVACTTARQCAEDTYSDLVRCEDGRCLEPRPPEACGLVHLLWECNECMKEACCPEAEACQGDAGCRGAAACPVACREPGCYGQCDARAPDPGELLRTWRTCLEWNCSSTCNLPCLGRQLNCGYEGLDRPCCPGLTCRDHVCRAE